MKVAFIAPVEEAVPPPKYGGTEVVIYNIITELVRLGHDVTLFASGDSKVPCNLEPIVDRAIRTIEPFASDPKAREHAKIVGIAKVIERLHYEQFDIIHNNAGWRFLAFAHVFKFPMITTFHGPRLEIYQQVVADSVPDQLFVSISENQRKGFPNLKFIRTIYNGIDTDLYPYKEKPDDGDYLFFLARFSPEKGAREAIEIAKKSGKKLKMAVKVDQVDKQYFEESKPLIDNTQVELLGELTMADKVRYLQNASALLAPIQWEEPFGLFVVEAMACGTPVIGTKRGSFPEIITSGQDGFLGATTDEMASYVKDVPTIARSACRKTVEDRFSKEQMAASYLSVYEEVIAKTKK